jgi:pimeloyl-ACP methyl ester carboxylesterase
MGGPGEDVISDAADLAAQFTALRKDHDLLLVDQRGTGRSGALHCDLYSPENPAASLRDVFPLEAVKRCERQLSERADLTQYTYIHFANDLEQIRLALGYGPLNLSSGSYGTRAAQVFMRTFPKQRPNGVSRQRGTDRRGQSGTSCGHIASGAREDPRCVLSRPRLQGCLSESARRVP